MTFISPFAPHGLKEGDRVLYIRRVPKKRVIRALVVKPMPNRIVIETETGTRYTVASWSLRRVETLAINPKPH